MKHDYKECPNRELLLERIKFTEAKIVATAEASERATKTTAEAAERATKTTAEASERATKTTAEAAERALTLQAQYNKEHFEKLNGEYERIDNVINTRVGKSEYTVNHEYLLKDIKELQEFRNNLLGKITVIGTISGLAGSVIVGLILHFVLK